MERRNSGRTMYKPGDYVRILVYRASGAYVDVDDVGVIVNKNEYPSGRYLEDPNMYAVRFTKAVGGHYDEFTAVIYKDHVEPYLRDEDIFEDCGG